MVATRHVSVKDGDLLLLVGTTKGVFVLTPGRPGPPSVAATTTRIGPAGSRAEADSVCTQSCRIPPTGGGSSSASPPAASTAATTAGAAGRRGIGESGPISCPTSTPSSGS